MENDVLENVGLKIQDIDGSWVLQTPYKEFAEAVYKKWAEKYGVSKHSVLRTSDGMSVYVEGKSNVPVTLNCFLLSDKDIEWFCGKRWVEHLQGDPSLLPLAKSTDPYMGEFIRSVTTGERMKKPVHIVKDCIEFTSRSMAVLYPTEAFDYVLNSCPEFGPWTEQHIDKFYELLREAM